MNCRNEGTNLLTTDNILSGFDTSRKTTSSAMNEKKKFSLLLDSSCPAKFLSETNIPQHVSATGYFPELNSRSLQSNTTNYFEKADMCPYVGFVWDYNN